MHDEWMSDETVSAERQLDQRLVRALETRPKVTIPADFAGRVASHLPPRKVPTLTPRHYGRKAMVACIIALALAMLALASNHIERSVFGVALEWILCAQFLVLVVWLGTKLQNLRG